MKRKTFYFLCAAAAVMTLTSCGFGFGPGFQDWSYDLSNGYQVLRVNTREILIGYKEPGGSVITQKTQKNGEIEPCGVDSYVSEFCTGDRFVGAQQAAVPSVGDKVDLSNPRYYLIDTKNQKVFGPFRTQGDYESACKKQGAASKMGKWIKTVPAPTGADYDD